MNQNNFNIFKAMLNRTPNEREEKWLETLSEERLIKELRFCSEKIESMRFLSGDHNKAKVFYDDEDINTFFSSNKYKVAICLSGHVRDYEKNLRSIKKYLVDPLNADVYMHTWDTIGKQKNSTNFVVGPIPDETQALDLEKIKAILTFKSIKVENNKDYLEELDKKINNKKFFIYGMFLNEKQGKLGGQAEPKYIYSQLYSVKESFKLIKNLDDYDIIIKLRADYNLMTGVEEKELDQAVQKNVLVVPNVPYSNHGHPICCLCNSDIEHDDHIEDICDIFSFGNKETMKYYMEIYDYLEKYNDDFNIANGDWPTKGTSYKEYKNFNLIDIWHKDDYKFHCFYPERLFRHHLSGYKLYPSKLCGEVIR